MKMRTPIRVAVATLFLGSLLSCHKELDVSPNGVATGKSSPKDDTAFDWENATSVPTAPGYSLRMPWASGVGSTLDISVASDYHHSDGWDMVYNTFTNNTNPTITSQPALYFTLYNRFRGILRYYYYCPGYSNYSTQLEHGLELMPNTSNSTMLNFEGKAIVDPLAGNNVKGFTKTSMVRLDNTGTWYMMQYQIAYDPNYTSTPYETFHPHWNAKIVNITDIKTDGKEFGNINGTITTPAPGKDWPSIAANGLVAAADIVGIVAGGDLFGPAAAGGLLSNATGILSGLFGGNSSNSQEVALTINSTITTTGSAISNGGLIDANFWLPGQASTTPANAPAAPIVTYPIGLFNLPTRPVVTMDYSGDGIPHSNQINDFYFTYSVDANAVYNALQKNPTVFNSDPSGAAITNFKATVIALNLPASFDADGTKETVGATTLYSGNPLTTHYQSAAYRGIPSGTIAVRVSFNVSPNTPNPNRQPIFIVKTFLAQVVK